MAAAVPWRDLWRGVGDLVFPPPERCAVCDNEAVRPSVRLCADCLRRLPFLRPPLCERCGRMLRLCAAQDGSCRECSHERLFFSRARAACLYEGPARAYLHEVKFHRSSPLTTALADVLAAYVREQGGFRWYQVVVPVPLHAQRETERGFNQAAILAAAVARTLRRPFCREAVIRTRQTEAQSRLARDKRLQNVQGAFCVVDPSTLSGRRVLLVDDILTTGYTASECARVILRSGAIEVGVLTLANGVPDDAWLQGQPGSGKKS